MTPAQASLLRRWGEQVDVDVDDTAIERLSTYALLLGTWNARVRLTGDRDGAVLLEKHIPDCLAVARWVPAGGSVVDVGSGAGLPGVVLACVRPSAHAFLVESRRRPASFLLEAVRTVPLPGVTVVEDRWERWVENHPCQSQVVTGRAVRLESVLRDAPKVLSEGGAVVGMQSQRSDVGSLVGIGRRFGFELAETSRYRLPSGEDRVLAVFRRP